MACHSTQLQSLQPGITSYLACITLLLKSALEKNTAISSNITHHVENMSLVAMMTKYNSGWNWRLYEIEKQYMYIQLHIYIFQRLITLVAMFSHTRVYGI